MKTTTKHYNCLGCPQCGTPLHDPLIELELNFKVKTVKCENCDFIGLREGWILLNKNQENAYRKQFKSTSIQVSAYQGIPAL